MHRATTGTASTRARWERRPPNFGVLAALALTLLAPPARAEVGPWLALSVTTHEETLIVTLQNRSTSYLHGIEPGRWGLNNYLKVGTEVRPLSAGRLGPTYTEGRPDLDGAMSAVAWALIEVGPDGIAPGARVSLTIPRPLTRRGQVDLVVLARKKGDKWITLRETVATEVLIPGDTGRALAWLGILLASLFFARRPRRPDFGVREAVSHSIGVLLATGLAIAYLDGLHYRELPHSDGANYAVVARSVAEGRGLISPIIQPGLIGLARTDGREQAFIIQAPGWPLVLGQVFRLAGATPRNEAVTGYVLLGLATVGVFWLAALSAGSAWAGYLAAAVTLSAPPVFASAVAGSNAPLQSLLIVSLFLLLFRRPTTFTMAMAGLLSGLGLVVRETMLFAIAAFVIAAWWYGRDRIPHGAQTRAIAVFLLFLAGPLLVDRARRVEASTGEAFPTVSATLLYGTSQTDARWYWRDAAPWTGVGPLTYLANHPGELAQKVRNQFVNTFLLGTLPNLVSFTPMLLPVIWPLAVARERRAATAAAVLATLLLALGGSVAYLHRSYFNAFFPVLAAGIAASLDGILRRVPSSSRSGRAMLLAAAAYGLLPVIVNGETVSRPGAVDVGEYFDNPTALRHLCDFVNRETREDGLIAIAHHPAPRLAWYVRRSFLQYDPGPDLRIGPTPMWASILRRRPVDYILLTSYMDRGDEALPPGFVLRATLSESGIKAWLYERALESRALKAGPTPPRSSP